MKTMAELLDEIGDEAHSDDIRPRTIDDLLTQALAERYGRVAELLAANNAEVERRRAAELSVLRWRRRVEAAEATLIELRGMCFDRSVADSSARIVRVAKRIDAALEA